MSENVQITFYNGNLERLFSTNDYTSLRTVKTLNKVGTAIIDIPAKILANDFELLSEEDLIMLVEVYINGSKIGEDEAYVLDTFQEFNNDKEELFRLSMKDSISILKRRINPYRADDPEGSELRSRINDEPGNQAMNRIIDQNYGVTAEPLRRIPQITTIGINQPSPIINKEIAFKNVLSVLQQITRTSSDKGTRLFFDLVPIATSTGIRFEFRTYVDQRGADKRGQEYIETTNPLFLFNSFIIDYDLPSIAYVGGSGKGRDRLVGFADTQRSVNGIFARREIFKTEQSSIQKVLDDEASELVSEQSAYRIDGQLLGDLGLRYQFGDILTVTHRGLSLDVEVSSIRTTYDRQEFRRELIIKSIV